MRYVIIGSVRRTDFDLRDLLPDTFDVTNFGLTTQFTFRSDFPCDLLHLGGECSELVNHTIDGVNQIQHLSGDTDTDHLLGEVTSRDGRLRYIKSTCSTKANGRSYLTVAVAIVRTCKVSYLRMHT